MSENHKLLWVFIMVFLASNLFLAFDNSNWNFIDESSYIPASIALLNGESCSIANATIPTPTVCNYEHPPLVKVLEAVSLYAFGWVVPKSAYPHPEVLFNSSSSSSGVLEVISYPSRFLGDISSSPLWFLSFRFFQLLMGTLSLVLVYVIAHRISGNARLAMLSSLLLLIEPLYAFFSRTAYLDVPMVFFALCAYAVFFSSFRLGPINEYWLTGALFGLSVLSKEPGIVFLFPLGAYHIVFVAGKGARKRATMEIAKVFVGMVAVSVAGLQIYDTFARTPFPTFLDHIAYIAAYSTSFICKGTCSRGLGPFAWFAFFVPNSSSISLSGNQVLLWLVFLWIPLGLHSIWKSSRRGLVSSPDDRLFAFASLFFGSTFVEDALFYAGGRTIWVWYFVAEIPSLALGGAYLLTRNVIPNWARVAIVSLLLIGCLLAYAIGPNLLKFD